MRVLFFGAGASKGLGLPLTGELLPMMIASARKEELFSGHKNGEQKRNELLETVTGLAPGFKLPELVPSITDLLSLIDYALAEGFTPFKTGGAAKLRSSRAVLEAGLLEVLANQRISKGPLERLARVVGKSGTCVITTNYDFSTDNALLRMPADGNAHIDYGMPWRDVTTGNIHQRPEQPFASLFKLHGSVNWLGCPRCEHIYVNPHSDIALLDMDFEQNVFGEATTCHCGYAPLRRVIVSPSLSRTSYQTQLRSIHLGALEALRQASELYIVGYSLPTEDLLVRSLFMRGVVQRDEKVNVRVFQVSDSAKPQYQTLFKTPEYHTSGFEGFLVSVEEQG